MTKSTFRISLGLLLATMLVLVVVIAIRAIPPMPEQPPEPKLTTIDSSWPTWKKQMRKDCQELPPRRDRPAESFCQELQMEISRDNSGEW